MTHASITDFLTPEEIERAQALWQELKDTGRFAATVARDIIEPNMARINAALGQENDARYLAYAVEYVFGQADQMTAGHLWEWAQDTCQVCGAVIGYGLRFMHVGLCDRCTAAPKH
jgi:hypothetical protein